MKLIIAITSLAVAALSLTSCEGLKKAETFIGIAPAQQDTFNVSLEKDALKGVLELAANKPGIAATDTVNSVLDDVKDQVDKSTTAGKATVIITSAGKQALADYQKKATKQQLLSDGASLGLQALTLVAQ